MGSCCETECGLTPQNRAQKQTLKIVLGINAVMFVVIVGSAIVGRSTSLMADSLDNLGDAITYGLSLFAVSKGMETKAKVALFKGGLILFAALAVAVQVGYKFFVPSIPSYEIMGVFSLIGLAANAICLLLLWRHRNEDINMSSVWECSRNDIASNLSVFLAAGCVWYFAAAWPDLLIAVGLIVLLFRSAIRVSWTALSSLKEANA
jgi:Co/Zn/Cd efflux system component